MAVDMAIAYEHAVIRDLQLSLEYAHTDKRELKETVDALIAKLANAEKVIKAANGYCKAMEDNVDDASGHLAELLRALMEWHRNNK
jgi:septal ring factor EnvC (AmiA/AmiB activator)